MEGTAMKMRLKKIMKKILDVIVFIMTGKSDDAVDAGVCDFSGQGRNKYGR